MVVEEKDTPTPKGLDMRHTHTVVCMSGEFSVVTTEPLASFGLRLMTEGFIVRHDNPGAMLPKQKLSDEFVPPHAIFGVYEVLDNG